MDEAAFTWLLTPEGEATLESATSLYRSGLGPARASAELGRSVAAPHAAAALSQAVLREAAVVKFGDLAHSMYFTQEGLAQASSHRVATHRASRLAAASPSSVLDAGCGIGGDLVAMSQAELTVAGVDTDPLSVAVATANLRTLGLGGAVLAADAASLDLEPFGVVFARRPSTPEAPSAEFVERLLARAACVKAGSSMAHRQRPAGVEAEWVSDHGILQEVSLWASYLASAERRATVLGRGGLATLTEADDHGDVGTGPVRAYLYDPDPAVVGAGLVSALAAILGGRLLDEQIPYLTLDRLVDTPFARGYEVLDSLPSDEAALRAALLERGIGTLTVRQRGGVAVAPDALRERLALRGDVPGTIVMITVSGARTVILVRPMPGSASSSEPLDD